MEHPDGSGVSSERDIVFYNFSSMYMCVCALCVCPDLSGPQLVHLCMDSKIIRNNCCPQGVEVPFETFVQVG